MNNTDDKSSSSSDDPFARKAKAVFDQSVDSLDGQTQSSLNRSRQKALAEVDSRNISPGLWTRWVPAAGAATVALVAVSFWIREPQPDAPASDFELIMAEESFDMLQDLDFYLWLDIETQTELDPDANIDIG
jgi:hypothetical protein